MLGEYANVLIFLVLGVIFVAFNLFLGSLIRPRNPYPEKLTTYECGEEPVGGSWIQFNIRFYVIALDFIIFDVEVVLLYPWAVVALDFGWYGFAAMSVFVVVLLLGLAYAWKKKALEWVRPRIPQRPAAVSGVAAVGGGA
ncbi:MAG: NADH-quinone oxidoreductase subunit A [Candidatus Latescibacteria bacterium]|jgi:NADH-quinone oxidoreductase subunit A|nr:NADH-quinone oxidoreductase subunit A [Candidatus Latescibacterota bacterium]